MAIAADDDILQDFLVEAGELLEQLDEQLVELESRPDDPELLNAIFRAFHTVKGGAGFLGLEPMVELCHRTEDVFNVLRQGERRVDAELMDTVLKALDGVNEMFARVKAGEEPQPADPALLEALVALAQPEGGGDGAGETPAAAQAGAGQESAAAPGAQGAAEQAPPQEQRAAKDEGKGGDSDEITDEEFEALLDELQGRKAGTARAP
ncbi:MAG TPA: chemotaxis protein CheA, partial [Chromatiales bacterium]|nr:chemotaxis protein CheA [Chromatiales bacterium]